MMTLELLYAKCSEDTVFLKKKLKQEGHDAPGLLTWILSPGGTFVKAAYSVTMNIFRKFLFSFQIICKSRIKLCFHNKNVWYSWKLQGKVSYLIK